MSDDFKFFQVSRCDNFYPTMSGYTEFCRLPEGSVAVKMEARGDYLFVECEDGKKYRIDSTGKEVIHANLRMIK